MGKVYGGRHVAIVFGDCELDIATRELRREGKQVPIEPKVFDVLHMLIENRDRVVTKDELIDQVWQGRFISDSAVSTAIKTTRQAVGDDGRTQNIVRTIHGHGFRFVADVDIQTSTSNHQPVARSRTTSRSNLPLRQRELIGRDSESAELRAHIKPGRIVSIVGPGGAGKTALAIDIATSLLDQFPGGVWFCELAPAREGQVESAVLGAIDSSAGAGPVNAATIVERFGDAATLIILDNCEHVIDSASTLAEELMNKAPNLALLITSREALELPQEKLVHLGGLNYSKINSVAVQMFANCAQLVTDLSGGREETETLRKITARLEGLPLAIELAAPRLASSTPNELLEALDDQLSVLATRRRRGEPRHSAMDAAIAWSYDLLEPEEKNALVSLSVFSGAFTAQAAEAICDAPSTRAILHNLVGQSMVSFLPGAPTSRFRLLEPIRQFAQRQLDDGLQQTLRERHAKWFAQRVKKLAVQMRGEAEIEATEALTMEWSDVGRALTWGRTHGRAEIAVDPLVALQIHLLWQLRIEAFVWLEEGVAACKLTTEEQAKADLVRSMGAWSMGDLDKSEALMDASIKTGGETIETAYFQFYQGFAREDFDKVFRCGMAAWERARTGTDVAWRITTSAFLMCGYAMHKGDAPEIPGLFSDVEEMLAQHPWPSGECCALIGQTVAAFGRGDAMAVETFRIDLEKAADRCYAPWFKVTAAGIEASRTRSEFDAMGQLAMYTQSLKSALNSGDVIQMPTILRAIAICLVDVRQFDLAAKLSGLVPHVRGLGEKGSLAPGYEDAVERAKGEMESDAFNAYAKVGEGWELADAVEALEEVVSEHSV